MEKEQNNLLYDVVKRLFKEGVDVEEVLAAVEEIYENLSH